MLAKAMFLVTHPWGHCYILNHVRIGRKYKVNNDVSSCGLVDVLCVREIVCNVYHCIIDALSIFGRYTEGVVVPVYEVTPKKNIWEGVIHASVL